MPPCEQCRRNPITKSVPDGYRLVHLCDECYLALDALLKKDLEQFRPKLTLCQCRGYIASRYGMDEDGAQVPLCNACFMSIDSRLTREQRQENAKRNIQVEQLEEMWKLDGSWIKEGAVWR